MNPKLAKHRSTWYPEGAHTPYEQVCYRSMEAGDVVVMRSDGRKVKVVKVEDDKYQGYYTLFLDIPDFYWNMTRDIDWRATAELYMEQLDEIFHVPTTSTIATPTSKENASAEASPVETFRRHLQSTIDLRTPLIREAEESIKECKDVLNAIDVLHQHGLPFPISWRDAYVDLLRKGKKQRKLLSEKQIMDKKLMKWVCKQAA